MPQLHIDKRETTSNLQKEFNMHFPFLKIEFFRRVPAQGTGNSKKSIIKFDMRLSEIQLLNKQGVVDITESTTVKELEKCFEKDFGLYIQVFRKSGNIWLETTATTNWTLNQQNEEGRSLADHFRNESGDPD